MPRPPTPPLFPYTTLFRSRRYFALSNPGLPNNTCPGSLIDLPTPACAPTVVLSAIVKCPTIPTCPAIIQFSPNFDEPDMPDCARSEEHTSELQSRENLVCR